MTVRALAIAVGNYPSGSAVAGLEGVVEGAQRFLNALVQHAGLTQENTVFCCSSDAQGRTHAATKRDILAGIEHLLLRGGDDTEKLFIYIAGHGISTTVPGWTSSDSADLLLCADFMSPEDVDTTVCIDELLAQLAQRLGAGDHYAFIDICRTRCAMKASPLGLTRALAKTGVANQLRLSSAKPGDSATNDEEFLKVILTGLQGKGSADADDDNSKLHWVTFQSLRRDVEERLISMQRSCEIRVVGTGKFRIAKLPPGREVMTIRQSDALKVPPVKLLTYYDQVVFLGETNSQLAGVPRDKEWTEIRGGLNFLQQALALRAGRPWKKLEVFMLERLETAGRPSQSLSQLIQERDEAERFLVAHSAELAEELRVYRYEYAGYYGSMWSSDNGKRHVHMSPRVNGQDIRYAPANDFIDFPGDRLPQIELCFDNLNTVRSASSTISVFHYPPDTTQRRQLSDQVVTGDRALAPAILGHTIPETSNDSMPPTLRSLADRANRSLKFNTIEELVNRKRAIIGPKNIDQLTADAERARQLLLLGVRPSPLEMAALEQAIRLQRPAPACIRDGLTLLPIEGNWIANLWLQFQSTLKQVQSSVARLDRIDGPKQDTLGKTSIGTGFLVAEDLLVTAAHVVTEMSFGTGVLEPGQAEAEFEGYLNVAKKYICPIVQVVKYDPVIDLAILQLAKCKAQPIPLEPVSRPVPGFPICAIGYPQDDPRNAADLISLIFGGKFGVKRAAIGEVLSNTQHRFTHDCSTLGGVSGGPVFDINTGKLCGVHVAGQSLIHNEAVDAQCLVDFLKPVTRPRPAIRQLSTIAPVPAIVPVSPINTLALHVTDGNNNLANSHAVQVLETTLAIHIRVEIGNLTDVTSPVHSKPTSGSRPDRSPPSAS